MHKLYYADPYRTEFNATVTAVKSSGTRWAVALDSTAFYPEGGGQPADQGFLADNEVLDVQVDEAGIVWHYLNEELAQGALVVGRINWVRRYDHMTQHSGQHILSQAFWRLLAAKTVGFHLGKDSMTIDVDKSSVTQEELEQVEALANKTVRENRRVLAQSAATEDLNNSDLRKQPQVEKDIRLVNIEDYDICPCGGTHVAYTGEIGLIKILSAERRRGNLRIYFLAGERAYRDYNAKHALSQQLSASLSVPVTDICTGVERLQEKLLLAEREGKLLKEQLLEIEAGTLLDTNTLVAGVKVIAKQFAEREFNDLKALASKLATKENALVLFGLAGNPYRLLVAASEGIPLHAGNMLREVVSAYDGKGGGTPTAAQGALAEEYAAEAFAGFQERLCKEVMKLGAV